MNIAVCIKQILDPELPPRDFQVDRQAKKAVAANAPLVISPFDENALEVALKLREKLGQGKVTVITAGPQSAQDALRKALAMKADEAVHVSDPVLEALDSDGIASVLAAAIRKLGGFDLVLFGRQAGDWDFGQVGSLVAEKLELPCVTFVSRVEPAGPAGANGTGPLLTLRREADSGFEILEAHVPLVVTVTNDETNAPRLPSVRDTMMAFRKPIQNLSFGDLGLDASALTAAAAYVEVRDLFIPVQEGHCEMIPGENGEEMAVNLARKLADLKIL